MPNKRTKPKTKEIKEVPEKTGKQKKLFNNLLKTTQQFIQGRSFIPLTFSELQQRLHLPEQHADVLAEVLDTLVAMKIIEVSQGRYRCKQTAADVVTGILKLHPRGFGFVKPEDATGMAQDIFIPKHLTQNAVDGDTVEVLINNESFSEKGPEGRILNIISRARTHLAGIVREIGHDGTLYAYAPMLGIAQRIIVEADQDVTLDVGDRISMEVLDWGDKEGTTYCRLARHIGHISDPSCDIPAAVEEYELRSAFPARAIEEAQQFGNKVSAKDLRDRVDLRSVVCLTIDPDTAKDFDDAIDVSKDANGNYHLGVHIADVSHYVRPDSALDREAQIRCNSTYFPGVCIPMLPEELSNNLCSLKPNVNRLTISVLMQFTPQGDIIDYQIVRSVIKSSKRFTYKEAKAILDGKKQSPHRERLQLMVELCGLLKQKRYERGSIEFGMPELVVIVDENGVPTKTDYVVYDITHQLVEEFMLKANEIVALHLSKEGKHLTYRIHDEPSEENMKDFSLLAGAFGFHLSQNPTPKEIQKLFDEAMETPYGQYLATSYIRRMRLAVYSADNIGHYGLSLTHYCHFTSPIRRYVDLVVHRILFHEAQEKHKLDLIAENCSEQERVSAKAENSVVLLKKLRLLDKIHKIDPLQQYDAVVTRVKNFGIYLEILDLMLESYLHVSELHDDYYVFDEAAVILHGKYHGHSYRAGDKITVMLKEIDFITLDSKWGLVSEFPPKHRPAIRKEKSKAQAAKSKRSSSKQAQHRHPSKPKKVTIKAKKRKKR